MKPITQSARERCYELDWLRIGAVVLLITVHTAGIFDPFPPTAVKGNPNEALKIFAGFVHLWRLALLFIISGAGASFALRRQAGFDFMKMRLRRIGVPLIVGTLFVVPVQLYLWCSRIYPGRFNSYLEFYSQMLTAAVHGKIATKPEYLYWAHLWFLGYLLVYSLVTVPLFLYLRSESGTQLRAAFSRIAQSKGAIFLLILPLWLNELILRPIWPGFDGPNFINDWANVTSYLIYYVYGFLIYSDQRTRNAVQGWRYQALVFAVLTTILFFVVPVMFPVRAMSYNLPAMLFLSVRVLNAWFCIVTVFAFGVRFLQHGSRMLSRVNEAVYPVYVIHLPLLSIVAIYVVRLHVPVLVQFAAIVVATIVCSLLVYRIFIEQTNVTRFLFGLKLRQSASRDLPQTAEVSVQQDRAYEATFTSR